MSRTATRRFAYPSATKASLALASKEKIAGAEEAFLNLLPEPQRPYFKLEIRPCLEWGPQSHLAGRPVRFNIMGERRWVWRRAHSLGWSAERFESFERMLSGSRRERRLERIGKKYQWIAWHELQARLSDHLYFIGRTWHETHGPVFEGPWQLGARDIDPSLLMRPGDRDVSQRFTEKVWWRPAAIEHPDETTEERVARLWSDGGFPEVKDLLRVRDPHGKEWLVLDGFSVWGDRDDDRDPRPRRDPWLSIRSFLVERSDLSAVLTALEDEERVDTAVFRNRLEYYAFMGEHPWHPVSVDEIDEWRSGAAEPRPFEPLPVRHLIPIVECICEPGTDQSVEDRADLNLPSGELRQHLSLRSDGGGGVTFRGADNSIVFFDPTTERDGPPATLVAREPLLQMLEELEQTLVRWIGGEKGLYGRRFDHEFHGRHVLAGLYHTVGDAIQGREWRRDQRPSSDREVGP